MFRPCTLCVAVFIVLAPLSAGAQVLGLKGPSTADPKDPGYVYDQDDNIYPVEWQDVVDACKNLPQAESYNKVMRALLYTKFWIAYIKDEEDARNMNENIWGEKPPQEDADAEVSPEDQKVEAAKLAYKMGFEDVFSKLPALKEQSESLESLANDLRAELDVAQQQPCPKPGEQTEASTLGKNNRPESPLPFAWKGPYSATCNNCVNITHDLNTLPNLARPVMASHEDVIATVLFGEVETLVAQARHDELMFSDMTRAYEQRLRDYDRDEKKMQRQLDEIQKRQAKADQEVEADENTLDGLTQKFSQALEDYNACSRTCLEKAGPPRLPVTMPPASGPVTSPVPDIQPPDGEPFNE